MMQILSGRLGRVFGILLLVGPWGLGTALAEDAAPQPVRFGVDLVVHEVRGTMFTCRVSLVDLATGEALFEPNVTSRLGQSATASSEIEIDGVAYRAHLTVVASEGHASYEIVVTTGEVTVFTSKATLDLAS